MPCGRPGARATFGGIRATSGRAHNAHGVLYRSNGERSSTFPAQMPPASEPKRWTATQIMHVLRSVGLSLLAAIGYGVAHDQVTARICVEYFTLGHPPLFPPDSPTFPALGWGVAATWWVGLPLGLLL